MDPSTLVRKVPLAQNTPGAPNDSPQLPVLFLYLLNSFTKAIIKQFIDEAGVNPKAADPIGVVAVSIFSKPEFCWRGTSLIDILMAKFCVVAPVLWGMRGNEKTAEGRKRLGWWKEPKFDDDQSWASRQWVSEQMHNTRMTGLGAGYAAISLRDFSRMSISRNPYKPYHYWASMAAIVNTPPQEASSTQYTVLKAMIENYEERFLGFYGSIGKAALRNALVDFPDKAVSDGVAVASLKVLGDRLKKDYGLTLRPPVLANKGKFGGGQGGAFGS